MNKSFSIIICLFFIMSCRQNSRFSIAISEFKKEHVALSYFNKDKIDSLFRNVSPDSLYSKIHKSTKINNFYDIEFLKNKNEINLRIKPYPSYVVEMDSVTEIYNLVKDTLHVRGFLLNGEVPFAEVFIKQDYFSKKYKIDFVQGVLKREWDENLKGRDIFICDIKGNFFTIPLMYYFYFNANNELKAVRMRGDNMELSFNDLIEGQLRRIKRTSWIEKILKKRIEKSSKLEHPLKN